MPPRTRTTTPTQPESPTPAAAVEPAPDPGGWFRNTGTTALTVLGEGATHVLAPGRIAPLARTPTHRDLAAATEADYRAQQDADAEAATQPPAEPSTDETEA